MTGQENTVLQRLSEQLAELNAHFAAHRAETNTWRAAHDRRVTQLEADVREAAKHHSETSGARTQAREDRADEMARDQSVAGWIRFTVQMGWLGAAALIGGYIAAKLALNGGV